MNKNDKEINIYPSLLSDQLSELQSQAAKIIDQNPDSTVQIDIIDGKFAENLTCTPSDLADLDLGDLELDFHLMTEEPMDFVHELIDIKSQLRIRAVIGQVERMSSQNFFLKEVEQQQWLPGLSLDLFTPVEAIDDDSWEMIKVIQVMGVEAGFQGQDFHPSALNVLKEVKSKCLQHEVELIVDGGVNFETISSIIKAGADSVVVGSVLWKSESISATIDKLLYAAKP